MTKLSELDFTELLPDHLKKYDNIVSMVTIFGDEIKEKILPKVQNVFLYSDFEDMEDELLDELATAWHVDFYDEDMTTTEKAAMVENAYKAHSQKGTRGALQDALDSVFDDIQILEWFEYGGNAFYFKLVVEDAVPSADEIERIYAMVDCYKSKRSYMDGFTVSTSDSMTQQYSSGSHSSGRTITSQA